MKKFYVLSYALFLFLNGFPQSNAQNNDNKYYTESIEKAIKVISNAITNDVRYWVKDTAQILIQYKPVLTKYKGKLENIPDPYRIDSASLTNLSSDISSLVIAKNNKKNDSKINKLLRWISKESKTRKKFDKLLMILEVTTKPDYYINLNLDVYNDRIVCNYSFSRPDNIHDTISRVKFSDRKVVMYDIKNKLLSKNFLKGGIKDKALEDTYIYPIYAEGCKCDNEPDKPRIGYGIKVKGYPGILTTFHGLWGCDNFFTFDKQGNKVELYAHSIDLKNDIALLKTEKDQQLSSIKFGYDTINNIQKDNIFLATFKVKPTKESYAYKLLIKNTFDPYLIQSPDPGKYQMLDPSTLARESISFKDSRLSKGLGCINIPDVNNPYYFVNMGIEPGMPALGYSNPNINIPVINQVYGIVNSIDNERVSWIVPFNSIKLERCNFDKINQTLPFCSTINEFYFKSKKGKIEEATIPNNLIEEKYIKKILKNDSLPPTVTGSKSLNEKVFWQLNKGYKNGTRIKKTTDLSKLFKNFKYPLTFSYTCLYYDNSGKLNGQKNSALDILINNIDGLLETYYINASDNFKTYYQPNKHKIERDKKMMANFGITAEDIKDLRIKYASKKKDDAESDLLIKNYNNQKKTILGTFNDKPFESYNAWFDSLYTLLNKSVAIYQRLINKDNLKVTAFKEKDKISILDINQDLINKYVNYLNVHFDSIINIKIDKNTEDTNKIKNIETLVNFIRDVLSKTNKLLNLKPVTYTQGRIENCIFETSDSLKNKNGTAQDLAEKTNRCNSKLDSISRYKYLLTLEKKGATIDSTNRNSQEIAINKTDEKNKKSKDKPYKKEDFDETIVAENNKKIEETGYEIIPTYDKPANNEKSSARLVLSRKDTLITNYDIGYLDNNDSKKAINVFFEVLFKFDSTYEITSATTIVYGLADGYNYNNSFKYDSRFGSIDFHNHTDKDGNNDTRIIAPLKQKGIQLDNRKLALARAKFVQYLFDISFFDEKYAKFRPSDNNLFQEATPEKGNTHRGIRIEATYNYKEKRTLSKL